MWPFRRRKTLEESGFFQGFTDWHSHILPGVDDGVQTMEEALQILAEYERLGMKEAWLTPHVMEDIPNTTAYLRKQFIKLQEAYKGTIKLHLASEYMMDNLFEERLQKNDLLPISKEEKYLLVETSYFSPPMGLHNILLHIMSKGYHPILAHPERYVYMEKKDYNELKDLGVKFQLNLPSIVSMYGDRTKKKAMMLLREKAVAYIGTDTHNYNVFKKLICADVTRNIQRLLDF